VKARSDSGRAVRGGAVKVDAAARGPLTGGKLAVPDLAEGRHTVTIEVPGFRRYEEIVTVRGGEQLALDALLHASAAEAADAPDAPGPRDTRDRPVPRSGPSPLWKWAAGAGTAIALAAGGYAFYAYDRETNHNAPYYKVAIDLSTGKPYTDPQKPDWKDCGNTDAQIAASTHTVFVTGSRATFDRACTWRNRNFIGVGVAVAGGALAVTSLIMLSRDPGPAEGPASGSRGKKSDVAIVPILTPEVAGAELSLAW
jgi:hypothetical protein